MSEAINTGGSAFPYKVEIEGPGFDPVTGKTVVQGTTMHHHFSGMSLRDYFAGQSIQGVFVGGLHDKLYSDSVAKRAYELADAMIRAREGGAA